MALSDLTRDAVVAATKQYDELGRDAFLQQYPASVRHEIISCSLTVDATTRRRSRVLPTGSRYQRLAPCELPISAAVKQRSHEY